MTYGMRIGIYGGAFDPPHRAHVALAQAALQQLQLDRLYIIPTGQPWMKQRHLTAPVHRLAMARLAFAGMPQAVVDDCEIRRSGTTYTIDTLRELQQRTAHAAAGQATWFLVMGQDLVATLPRWQRAEELLQQVTVAVLTRPDAQTDTLDQDLAQLQQALPGLRTLRLQAPADIASSTTIRNGLQQRQQQSNAERLAWLQTLVPLPVAQYIAQHQLYLFPDGHQDCP